MPPKSKAKAPAVADNAPVAAGSGVAAAKALAKGAAKAKPAAKADPKAKADAKAEPAAKADPKAKAAAKSEPKAAAAAAAKGKAAPAKAAPKAPSAEEVAAAEAAAKAEEEARIAAEEEAKRKEEEAEEHKRLEELQKQEIQRKAEEEARRKEKENGDVILKYSMYNEKFPIKGGKITAPEIDEVYCLSDVMPGCVLHLSEKSPEEKYAMEAAEEVFPYIYEEPEGTFHNLEAECTYYVHVTEDEAEFLKSQARAKKAFAGVKSEAVRGEGCSCLEGNPCADEYICTDWHNRFALAKQHGWIGYQAM